MDPEAVATKENNLAMRAIGEQLVMIKEAILKERQATEAAAATGAKVVA